ncbi:hypothetical protein F4780DRAFT_249671 [Xylariomycetidae sp. FL0641]|nr:hypothetical protein F4780DRAFT_249671 [Xylariomycetidae sp. FL0641]
MNFNLRLPDLSSETLPSSEKRPRSESPPPAKRPRTSPLAESESSPHQTELPLGTTNEPPGDDRSWGHSCASCKQVPCRENACNSRVLSADSTEGRTRTAFEQLISDRAIPSDHPHPRGPAGKLLAKLPARRSIDCRGSREFNPSRSPNMLAALIQVTGRVVTSPCGDCARGYGVFRQCIVSDKLQGSLQNCCANHIYNSQASKCSFHHSQTRGPENMEFPVMTKESLPLTSNFMSGSRLTPGILNLQQILQGILHAKSVEERLVLAATLIRHDLQNWVKRSDQSKQDKDADVGKVHE